MTMRVLEKGVPFASDLEIGTGAIWLPYKNILDTVTRAIQDSSTEAFQELEACIRRYKPDFNNFLNYRGKSGSDRELLKKAVGDGIFLRGHDAKQALHPQLVNETLLLSDIFEINEFLALDLLATAETLKEEYPVWGRGLIAVALYYEGRLSMIQAVSTMVMAIPGRTWHQECFPRVYSMFQTVMGYIFKDDMIDSLIKLFEKSESKEQLELLDSNLALGDWRHRMDVNRMIDGIREGIAFIIFALAAQRELPWKDTLRLLEYLRKTIRLDEDTKINKSESLLLSAVMFCISNNLSLPDYNKSFAKELQKYIRDNEVRTENTGFYCYELFEFIRLNYYIMAHKAISEKNINSVQGLEPSNDILKDDEDYYFRKDLFAFMRHNIFNEERLFTFEANIMRRYHMMFTDFITFMPMKVKEMKVRSEDAAKTANLYHNQGVLRPPNLPHDYESFLECLGAFYSHDTLGLSTDFFDQDIKNLALNKLARGACIEAPSLFVPNAKFLTGLAKSSSNDVFELLKQDGHNFSFDHFFESILKYLSSFGSNQQGLNGPNFYSSEAYQKVVIDSMRVSMNPAEVYGICSYLDLVKVICDSSVKVSSYFTNQKLPWIRTMLHTAKVRPVPREIRAKMIATAASMISEQSSPEAVSGLWEMFYGAKLIGQENGDLKNELEEHEARYESYQLTLSMMKLLNALVDARFKQNETDAVTDGAVGNLDNGAFDPFVAYIRDTVLLKAFYRTYKDMRQRWEVAALCLEVLAKLLDYVPQLMFQLLSGSPLLKTVLTTIADCIRVREGTAEAIEEVDRCAYACLNLLRRALHRQGYFLRRRENPSGRESLIVGIQELIMKIIPETGRPEYMLAILKYIDNLQPSTHKQAALDILALTLADRDDIDAHLYAALTSDSNLVALLRYMFINTLYEVSGADDARKSVLQIIRVSVVHSQPNFAMMLLGVDKRIDFQNAGVAGYPRTVLHGILDNAPNLPDAFCTLLTLLRDPRLWGPLLRYLKTNHFFCNFLKQSFPSPAMGEQDIGYLLKCMAVELKTTYNPGILADSIIREECGKFQEVLNMLDLDQESLEIPDLEFFDADNVMQAMKSCEYFDPKLKIRVTRIDMLENLLKEEISKLEKNTVMRLRHTVQNEAKAVIAFAKEFNNSRWKEASKINMFDGWRQCLEVLVLNPGTLNIAGVDFVTSILRILLIKVVGTSSGTEFFCRLAAETVLTLSAVMGTFKDQVNTTTLNVILGNMCKWISEEQSPRVRATLYAAILHVVQMFKVPNEAGNACVNSFSIILDHLSKDCCQSPEIGKMQAMYLMGEIIRLTNERGLGGGSEFVIGEDLQKSAIFSTSISNFAAERSMSFQSPSGGGLNSSRHNRNTSPYAVEAFNTSAPKFSSTKLKPTATPGGSKGVDYLPSHLNIMTYMFAKGFLGNLVKAIAVVDDADLAQLFTNQQMQPHMKSLYVFEAKMSLLCRFASTGRKAALLLMEANIVQKLADMHVFEIHYYEETSSTSNSLPQLGLGESTLFGADSLHNMTTPTRKGVMESLFSNVLKLLHVMLDSASKNVLLVEQIWHFLTTHDEALANLISRKIIIQDEQNISCTLLTSLLVKVANQLPAAAFTCKTHIMIRMMDILKVQAGQPSQSEFRVSVVKDALLFFYNHSNNKEFVREQKKQKSSCQFRPVVNKKLGSDMMIGNPDEELTIGVIVKIMCDIASMIVSNHTAGHIQKAKMSSAICILEVGLTLCYFHVELFLNSPTHQAQQFVEEFSPLLDNKLVKYTNDAVKITNQREFIEMLLLRLRRLVHASPKT